MKKLKQKELENKLNELDEKIIEKEYIHISDEDFLAFEKMIEEGILTNQNSVDGFFYDVDNQTK